MRFEKEKQVFIRAFLHLLLHIKAWEVILAIALFFTIVEVVTATLLIYGTIKVRLMTQCIDC